MPPVRDQRRISSVLAAIDELIEINDRRIEVLDDLARSLYREWFVRFRFPGHEDLELVDTEIGRTPDSWEIQPLASIASSVNDSVEASALRSGVDYVGLEHIPRRSTTMRAWGEADSVSSRKLRFERGDVLFGKIRPYFHKVAWAPISGVASSDAIILRARPDLNAFVTELAASDEFVAHSIATSNGTKMPRADWKVLRDWRVAVPPPEIAGQFEEIVGQGLVLAADLATQNRALARTRDLLLPRLVTGHLDISDVDLGGLLPAEVA
jgi:type I restriction enzyme S subunit